MDFETFLHRFLSVDQRNDLVEAGTPLYAYKVKEHEFITLQNLLKDKSLFFACNETVAKCFVLYASEWWRREYQGGHWTWDGIFKSIDRLGMSSNDITPYVKKGIKAWGRSIPHTNAGFSYIGAIALESGIPAKLLNDDNKLVRLLTNSYQQLSSYTSSVDITEIIKEKAEQYNLAQTLRKPEFFSLLSIIIKTLNKLSIEFQLTGEQSPVSVLDTKSPNWRERFPLRIDDQESAKSFLNNLLSDVVKVEQTRKTIKPILQPEYLLEEKESQYAVSARLEITSGYYGYEQLGLSQQQFKSAPERLALRLETDEKTQQLQYIYKNDSKEGYRIERRAITLASDTLRTTSDLQLWDDDQLFHTLIAVENLSQMADPLVFTEKDGRWSLKTTGSCRLKEETAKIAIPSSYRIQGDCYDKIG